MSISSEIALDPVESSKLAGLRYVTDDKPGITRRRRGKGFQYFDAEGKRITDA
jgi:DNA topoisomerase-1